jgi:hypothetical protein
MAKEEIGFNVTVGGVEKSISSFKDLKEAIKAAQDEQIAMSLKFGSTSAETVNATKKVNDLKDKIDDLNDSSKTLKGTGFEMLKGGFAQVEEGLMNLDFDKVKTGLVSMVEGFKSMGSQAMAAFKGIKGAIAATGIGLLVIALGTIYAYWDDIKGVVDGLTPELKKQNELAAERVKLADKALEDAQLEENALRLQGKTEKEILLIKEANLKKAIESRISAIKQAEETKQSQIDASERNKNILEGIIKFVSVPIVALLQGIDSIGSAFGKNFGLAKGFTSGLAKLVFDPDKVKADNEAEVAANKLKLQQLESQLAGNSLAINAIDKKTNEDKVKNANDAAKQKLLIELELQGKLQDLQTELIYDEREKEEKILAIKYEAERKSLISKGANIETLKALDDLYGKQKGDILDKYLKIEDDKAINIINKTKEINANLIDDEEEKALKILEIKNKLDRDALLNTLQRNKETNVLTEESNNLLIAFDKQYLKQKGDLQETFEKQKVSKYLSRLESEYQLESQRLTNQGKNLQEGSQAEEENNANKVKLEKKHLKEIYDINIANAELLGLDTTDLKNKYLKETEALEDAARERKKAKEKKLQQDIVDSVNIAAQTTLSVQKTLSDTYYMKETQKINKLYADKLKNVKQGSKEETKILEQKEKDEKNLARKQFETQKKFNRASAILNGILGLGAIFAVPDPTLGIVSAIRAAALVATTAANISQINATEFDEGGSSAGAIPKPEEVPDTKKEAPAIYGPGQGQSTTFSGNQNNSFGPVKAYVVETENRSTTNRVNKLVSESTYG